MIEMRRLSAVAVVEANDAESFGDELIAQAVRPEVPLHAEPGDQQQRVAVARAVLIEDQLDGSVDREVLGSTHVGLSDALPIVVDDTAAADAVVDSLSR